MSRKYLEEGGASQSKVQTLVNPSKVSIISDEATAYLRDPSVMTVN
jgi:hypothetical protein